MQVKSIKQSDLTAECWAVQMWGIGKCEKCEFRNTPDCGGKEIRKTGKNQIGTVVPI